MACGKFDTGKEFEWKGRPIDAPLIGGDAGVAMRKNDPLLGKVKLGN